MDSLAKQGRTHLLVILSAIVAPEVLIAVLLSLFAPQNIGVTQLVRWILTVILVFFTYKGYYWARWIMSILLLIAGVYGTVLASQVLAVNRIGGILLIFLSMFYVLSGMSLRKSEEIKSFCKYQRNSRKK